MYRGPRFSAWRVAETTHVDAASSDNGRKCRRLAAARFTSLFGDLAGWQRASTSQRLQAPADVRSFVAFAAVQAQIAIDAEYVVRSASKWGSHQADLDRLTAAAFRAEATAWGSSSGRATRCGPSSPRSP